jgi:TetR/AcrR family transcriptional repressor of lmrAB and yxaGH operons
LLAAIAGAGDLGAAVDALIGALGDELEASDWKHGCPVATVALESPSEPVRAMIAEHFEQWLGISSELMVRFGVPREVVGELALVAMSAIEGALLLARVKRSREPLRAVGRALRAMAAPFVGAAGDAAGAAGAAGAKKKPAKR